MKKASHHEDAPHDHDRHHHKEHDHGASDGHDPLGHHHDTSGMSDGRLIVSVVLNLILTVVEIVVGILSGSLALIADAIHNFGDVGALVIAWIARRISRKSADERYTFGYRRAELVGALINLTALLVMSAFMIMEAIQRIMNPEPIKATWVIIAASVAVIIDLGTVILLWGMSRGNLNIRAAFLHNLSDAAASVAVIIGAVFVKIFGWMWVDPAMCLLIAGYIIATSVPMLKNAAAILMNQVPPHVDISEIETTFSDFDEIIEAHHLHVWEIDEQTVGLEAHIVLVTDLNTEQLQPLSKQLRIRLKERWKVHHTTFEFEPPDSECTRRQC